MVRKSPRQPINESSVQNEAPSQLSSRRSVMRPTNSKPSRQSNRMSLRSISRSRTSSKTAIDLDDRDTALHRMRQGLINNKNPNGNSALEVLQSYMLVDQSTKSMEKTYKKMVAMRDQSPEIDFSSIKSHNEMQEEKNKNKAVMLGLPGEFGIKPYGDNAVERPPIIPTPYSKRSQSKESLEVQVPRKESDDITTDRNSNRKPSSNLETSEQSVGTSALPNSKPKWTAIGRHLLNIDKPKKKSQPKRVNFSKMPAPDLELKWKGKSKIDTKREAYPTKSKKDSTKEVLNKT